MSGSLGMSNSGGSSKPQMKPQDMLNLYTQAMPTVLGTAYGQAPLADLALAGSAAAANPVYTASGLNQLADYGRGYGAVGNALSQDQAMNSAQLLAGGGGLTALMGAGLNNLLNPAQAANNSAASNLVKSINLNGLSPGEYNATERSLNQSNQMSGNMGIANGTNAISNAMNFGGAFNNKLGILSNALGASNNVAQSQTNSINPTNIALNAGNTSGNFGLGQFNPTQANSTITSPITFASGLGNQVAQNASASKGSSSSNSFNTGGGANCFLTTACCEYKGLPDNCEELTILREFRDRAVPKELVKEYYEKGPSIVQKILNNNVYLDYVFNVITKCVQDIKNGRDELALQRYKDMVNNLQKV